MIRCVQSEISDVFPVKIWVNCFSTGFCNHQAVLCWAKPLRPTLRQIRELTKAFLSGALGPRWLGTAVVMNKGLDSYGFLVVENFDVFLVFGKFGFGPFREPFGQIGLSKFPKNTYQQDTPKILSSSRSISSKITSVQCLRLTSSPRLPTSKPRPRPKSVGLKMWIDRRIGGEIATWRKDGRRGVFPSTGCKKQLVDDFYQKSWVVFFSNKLV